ncbi:5'-nucleotidase C-terminal domain-containing protein [Oceanihabitans sp. 2_MG-2023]|uniref:5'-nucleotidase C-terminal domain-containing protein n=1 Tax=Oceanihabitans sp. 2_MG-2023 TaxID=3062661 RepID=UPI0026E2B47D|nr:5'-nucleotidase C-terminal domain-containing protein [Oceanihabitans sp. 2_MG-2023]MDO6597177.1 5'-nucleotidase C-terminal domain-containing protein [Oceanihabitans sp. 2_MG-2023]
MNYKHLLFIGIALLIYSCKQESLQLIKIEGKNINVNDSLQTDSEIEDFIKPYREHVNNNLDSVISFAVDTYSKRDGEFNTAIGNLFADAILEESNTVFNKQTGHNVDMVLVNHGGIRAIISKGNITTRTAYEIMPFENSLVVVAMQGKTIQDSLIRYLSRAKRAHPISGLKLKLDKDYNAISASIKNQPIDTEKTYYVATNDYLYNGGDRMTFFQTNDSLYVLNYKVRNALLDYFLKKDTINPVIDDRFIQIN